ncbi:hypothetical protein [Gloeothece citriformis]|nr:hypothetical protein [Gloeothece citriformis]
MITLPRSSYLRSQFKEVKLGHKLNKVKVSPEWWAVPTLLRKWV